jgi:2'-5' RNA ligase
VDEGRLAELRHLAITGRRHELRIEQARHWAHNRIVWAGPIDVPAVLVELAKELGLLLDQKGFRTEKREFAAHVTLVRDARAPDGLPPLPATRWPVEEVVLVESRSAEGGRRYEVRQRYGLA